MGRKTTPREMKVLAGTLQPCRDNPDQVQYQPLSRVPSPPKHFTKEGKKIYRDTAKDLQALGLLNMVNLPLLQAYANEIAIYMEYNQKLSELDDRMDTYVSSKGAIKKEIHIWQRIAHNALSKAQSLAGEFGLTPSSQTKIKHPKGTKKKSELQKLLSGDFEEAEVIN